MHKKVFLVCLAILFCLSAHAAAKPLTLSLNEAILLAVRSNPNVQQSQLSYVSQKFNLWIQEWQFLPHYSFQAQAIGGGNNTMNAQPAATLLTPIGTQFTLAASNIQTRQYSPGLSLQIMQPLIRGFGKAIVEAALNNARDNELISRLNIEGILRTTVTAVIVAYLEVVSAERTLQIDEAALKRAERSIEQTKIFIKAGRKAGNELVTVKADVASVKTQLENDKNNLQQARYALMAAIGMDPNTPVQFTDIQVEELISKYHAPTLENTKQLILENDIQYQTAEIILHGSTKRGLMLAEDSTRWQLNIAANLGTQNRGSNNATLTLQIPIDDQIAKQAVLNAKIALQQAELALQQDKWSKQTTAINGWNSVISAKRALVYASDAEKWQAKTYDVSYQKYLHGLIDSLELQTAQLQLIQAQQTSLTARINYLKALVNLDLLIGNTLKTWDVKVRLG